jgi:hypothetical protein
MESYYLCIKSTVYEKVIWRYNSCGYYLNSRWMWRSGRTGSTTQNPTTNSTITIIWLSIKKSFLS